MMALALRSVSSLKIAGTLLGLWAAFSLVAPHQSNPFSRLVLLSHQVPVLQVLLVEPDAAVQGDHLIRYQKGWWDLAFISYYIIVFSFLRQSTTIWIFKPFAQRWGITNETKQIRLMEQGYAILYWGSFGLFGLFVMSKQDSWWYQLEHLWLKYPHWLMRPELKAYYLLQFSYWLQQALVMVLKLEKPRKDYYELIVHHIVTLWLIGWSYLLNLTMIGTTVFVAMDIPDAWFALSKFFNYLNLDRITTPLFVWFIGVWSYFRIYLSAKTLRSIYYDFHLVPTAARSWDPRQGFWLADWVQFQIFAPLFLLFLLNCFWYVLILRIAFRTLLGNELADEREEGEYDQEKETIKTAEEKGKAAVKGKGS